MTGKKRLPALAVCIVFSLSLAVAEPWARIVFAEGSSFNLVRSGTVQKKDVASADVIGFELASGDILQTAPSTFIEIYINNVAASVQIAENTSFRCETSGTGGETKGELYYGRVRAKLGKLSGSKSFRITSPSLVAGVRGTDFGCDVIAVPVSESAPGTAILSRVFCFEGSVAVNPVKDPVSELVVVESGEMVERQLEKKPADASGSARIEYAEPAPLEKKPITDQISGFWSTRPVVGPGAAIQGSTDQSAPAADSALAADSAPAANSALAADSALAANSAPAAGPAFAENPADTVFSEPDVPVFQREAPVLRSDGIETRAILFNGLEAVKPKRNLRIPDTATAILMTAGSFCTIGAAYWGEYQNPDEVLVTPVHSAGLAMIGSAVFLSILSALVP